jgi:hypothetical protein
MCPAPAAELLHLQALGRLLLVLRRDVVPTFALAARQGDVVSHDGSRLLGWNFERTGADDRDRTGDLVLTKDVLCQLSYIGLRACGASARRVGLAAAAATTRRQPFDRACRAEARWQSPPPSGERETGIEPATNSLEGCDSTIELLPQSLLAHPLPYRTTTAPRLWWRGKDSNLRSH